LLIVDEKDFFLNDDEPHLLQTILPPRDLSDTKLEDPQLMQRIILRINSHRILINYII